MHADVPSSLYRERTELLLLLLLVVVVPTWNLAALAMTSRFQDR